MTSLVLVRHQNHKDKLAGKVDISVLLKEPHFLNSREVVAGDEVGLLNLNNRRNMEVEVEGTIRVVVVAPNLVGE